MNCKLAFLVAICACAFFMSAANAGVAPDSTLSASQVETFSSTAANGEAPGQSQALFSTLIQNPNRAQCWQCSPPCSGGGCCNDGYPQCCTVNGICRCCRG